MEIHLPEEIKHYEPELRFFVDLMVRKLHANRHKGFGEGKSLADIVQLMDVERDELVHAVENESQFDVALEAVDVSNFAFLCALVALRQTREEFNNGQK